jgi:hypothetical protein
MLSAVYYPHTTLHVEDIAAQRVLKRSLLLWDELQFIVPFPGFRGSYQDPQVARAVELIGVNHYPTDEEKRLAHEHTEELVTRPNLPEVFFARGPVRTERVPTEEIEYMRWEAERWMKRHIPAAFRHDPWFVNPSRSTDVGAYVPRQ